MTLEAKIVRIKRALDKDDTKVINAMYEAQQQRKASIQKILDNQDETLIDLMYDAMKEAKSAKTTPETAQSLPATPKTPREKIPITIYGHVPYPYDMKGMKWTYEQDMKLKELLKAKVPFQAIADIMRRTELAIESHIADEADKLALVGQSSAKQAAQFSMSEHELISCRIARDNLKRRRLY